MPRDKYREAINAQRSVGVVVTDQPTSIDASLQAQISALQARVEAAEANIVTLAFADVVTYSDQTSILFDSLTLSAAMDNVFGSTRGAILYRGASGWVKLDPGTAGHQLETNGAGADPSWDVA